MIDYSNHSHKNFIDAALADGWTISPSPWGNGEHDRSVQIQKELPELDGYFNLWMIDRDLENSYRQHNKETGEYEIVKDYSQDVAQYLWYCQRQEPYADRQSSLDTDVISFDEYSLDALLQEANKCPVCNKVVPANELTLVAFANTACDECVKQERKRLETPGWSN